MVSLRMFGLDLKVGQIGSFIRPAINTMHLFTDLYVALLRISRSEHVVVDDAGEDDGTEKKKKKKKGAQDEASEYALVAADAGEDDGPKKKKKKKKRGINSTSRGSPRMILNGYVRRDTYRMKKDNDEKIYRRLDSCLVIPPPKGKKSKAIIKFLGAAFIWAIPEVTYCYLIRLLANEGYLFISVQYNVTFDHLQAAKEVFERFYSCLNSMLTYGLPSDGLLAAELVDLPLYSVGHSYGDLFQVLSGSYFSDKLQKALNKGSTLLRASNVIGSRPQVSQMIAICGKQSSLYLSIAHWRKIANKEKACKRNQRQPKRLASSFFVFMEGFRKQFKEENPTINSIDAVGKAGGAKWKANK
ncbi:alpha/beta hydrolase fold protein [Tanacetum coccineum]